MPLITRRTLNGTLETTGELARGTRLVHIQWRDGPDAPWLPPLGAMAPLAVATAREVLARGPLRHAEYRLTEAVTNAAPDGPPSASPKPLPTPTATAKRVARKPAKTPTKPTAKKGAAQ